VSSAAAALTAAAAAIAAAVPAPSARVGGGGGGGGGCGTTRASLMSRFQDARREALVDEDAAMVGCMEWRGRGVERCLVYSLNHPPANQQHVQALQLAKAWQVEADMEVKRQVRLGSAQLQRGQTHTLTPTPTP